jgi:two-component system, sensor histidine kinase and response regulator
MQNDPISQILSRWTNEIETSIRLSSSLCIALFSSNGRFVYANESMNSLFKGTPGESFINPTLNSLLDMKPVNSILYKGFITLGDYSSVNTSIQGTIYRKDTELLIIGGIDVNQLTVHNEFMHQLNREISNLQRQIIKEKNTLESILAQLNIANKELLELNATKDKFFSILAHDLKNPFQSLLGFSELLLANIQNYDRAKIENQVRFIHKTTKHTFKLLSDLLLWSKSQSGKLTFAPQDINLEDLVNEVVSDASVSAQLKGIQINYIKTEDINISADPDMLKTIFRNLLSNAVKFSFPEGYIRIFAQTENRQVEITVADKGIGIAREDQFKLWNIANQFTRRGTAGEKGTGLGLILCKEFIEKHGGKISVKSIKGEGSRFVFTLPIITQAS